MEPSNPEVGRLRAQVRLQQAHIEELTEQVLRVNQQNSLLAYQNRSLAQEAAGAGPAGAYASAAAEQTQRAAKPEGCFGCAALHTELQALQDLVRQKQAQIEEYRRQEQGLREQVEAQRAQTEQYERQVARLSQLPAPQKRRAVAQESYQRVALLNAEVHSKINNLTTGLHGSLGVVRSAEDNQSAISALQQQLLTPKCQSSQLAGNEGEAARPLDFAARIKKIREDKKMKAIESPIFRQFQLKQKLHLPPNASVKLPTTTQVQALFSAFSAEQRRAVCRSIKPSGIRAILASLECQTLLGHRCDSFQAMQAWVWLNYDEEVEQELKRLLCRRLGHGAADARRTGQLALKQYATDANDSLWQVCVVCTMLYVLLDGQEIMVGQEEQWWLDGLRVL